MLELVNSKNPLKLEPEEWKQIIDINLIGVYYVTRTVFPQLIDKNGGDIINISSTAGQNVNLLPVRTLLQSLEFLY